MNGYRTGEVDAFLARRPYFDRAHVEEIATSAHREGIPFCPSCADYHHDDEDCTGDEGFAPG